ncbi:MAG: choice-of-anchor tandem repeat GloVer-containing protein [Thermosynechococcaceae cyanobacterium]
MKSSFAVGAIAFSSIIALVYAANAKRPIPTAPHLSASATLRTVVNFKRTNGSSPTAALIQADDGNFYGTTVAGGTGSACLSNCGTVFRLSPDGTLKTLVNFKQTNGRYPVAALLQANDRNFYGTTSGGGRFNRGTVFRMAANGTLATLVNFNGLNGSNPSAELIQAKDGNFYGTTTQGGSFDKGTVFRMTAAGTLTTLANFRGKNGDFPTAKLVQANDGHFYGTTRFGGTSRKGTIFRMKANGDLTTLVNFDGRNGDEPIAGLIQAKDGNFYGTTAAGGTSKNCFSGCGTVFKMTPNGTLSILANFNIGNGSQPLAGLIQASDGRFYGTTSGRVESDSQRASGTGTVFSIKNRGTLTTLVNFNGRNGSEPWAELIQAKDAKFYGTTNEGGTSGSGTVFKLAVP